MEGDAVFFWGKLVKQLVKVGLGLGLGRLGLVGVGVCFFSVDHFSDQFGVFGVSLFGGFVMDYTSQFLWGLPHTTVNHHDPGFFMLHVSRFFVLEDRLS